MVVQLLIVVSVDVATREKSLDVLEELGIDRHHVFEVSMSWTIFDHPDLTVAFDDLRLDLADIFIDQVRNFALAAKNLFARFDHAVRAE